jgi:nitrite reductase/ring-hydroxylating ferredoxin subunit
VVPVEVMSHQFALFRTAAGEVGMMDSQCCHMGADLSRCGTVSGERLVCGYHAWEFETDGRCAVVSEVPTEKIPKRAGQHAVPVVEYAGNIWFWYGPLPAREFMPIPCFESSRHLVLKGEVHFGRGGPLPIAEHISDSYHFPYKHKATGRVYYTVTENTADRFEFLLEPAPGGETASVQKLFKAFAFVEMAGPCIAVYRTQQDTTVNRDAALLTLLLSATPVRENLTMFTWRIAVRKPVPALLGGGVANRALAALMWLVVRRNFRIDLEVLRWMRPPDKTLWVKPDGSSVREFRAFYHRNVVPGWRFGRGRRPVQAEPTAVGTDIDTDTGVDTGIDAELDVDSDTSARVGA